MEKDEKRIKVMKGIKERKKWMKDEDMKEMLIYSFVFMLVLIHVCDDIT
jgi:hypothetical protein